MTRAIPKRPATECQGGNHQRELRHGIYRKLLEVVPELLTIEEHGKSVVAGLMDLNLDVLQRTSSKVVIALSHYYKHPSGDMIADPDMEIAVYPDEQAAEALTYQDTFGYRVVYHGENHVDVRAKKDLNSFLHQWLRNLIEQGHRITGDSTTSTGKELEIG